MARLDSSTGELLESRRICSIHGARGLPGRRLLQSRPGRRPTGVPAARHVRRNVTLKPDSVSKYLDATGRQDFAHGVRAVRACTST